MKEEYKECLNCGKFTYYTPTVCECIFTDQGVVSIPNCVCHKCLLKTMCTEDSANYCEEFILHLKDVCPQRDSPEQGYYLYISSLVNNLMKSKEQQTHENF